ncbi:MAG: hypothetical protein ACRD0J_14055 [Acidimicrobiales bacterium]
MTCPVCHRSRMIEIGLTLAERSVVMRSCSTCDTRWWQEDGQPAALPRVLELAAATRRA